MIYVFDSEDSFDLTYDELIDIISKARMTGPQMITILNNGRMINDTKSRND